MPTAAPPTAFVAEPDDAIDGEVEMNQAEPATDTTGVQAVPEGPGPITMTDRAAPFEAASVQPDQLTTTSSAGTQPPAEAQPDLAVLERAFHAAMVDVYRRARQEAGYQATYFLQMVFERGGLEAARRLLHATNPSEGFTALWERRRLDLTVEAIVLKPEFAPLFTNEERDIARARLHEYGYPGAK